MARSYSRDGQGRFASGGSKGNRAETIQQNKARRDAEQRKAREELSGNRLGGKKRTRRPTRTVSAGKRATTKAMRNSTERAKKRFR